MKRIIWLFLVLWLFSCQTSTPSVTASPETGDYYNALAERRYRSVVRIMTGCKTTASGVVVSPTKIITAKHVLDDCEVKRVKIIGYNDLSTFAVEDKNSAEHDVMSLRSETWLTYFVDVDKRDLKIGEPVTYMGGNSYFPRIITKHGEVNALTSPYNTILVSIHTVSGNSGGPVFDKNWNVVGILVQRDPSTVLTHISDWEHGGGLVSSKHFP